MASGFMSHTRLVYGRAKRDTKKRLREWLSQEALLAIATAIVAYFFSPGTRAERALLGIGIPLAGVGAWIIGLFIWNLVVAPSEIYGEQERNHTNEITTARDQISCLKSELARLTPPFQLAEEDHRVFMKPLNHEFKSLGLVGFELVNDGQRVNPAQGITVQIIPHLPAIRFEYVDWLRANELKRITPIISDYFVPQPCNILSELDKAWRKAWDDKSLTEVMINEAEFPFEIKLYYRDFRPRQFETTVSLRYCPVDYDAICREGVGVNRGYIPIKVTDTTFRRLS
jgi:hypothetical protein